MKTLASMDKLNKAISNMDKREETAEAKRYINENREGIVDAVFQLYLNEDGFDIELPSYVGYGVDKQNTIPSDIALELIMKLKEFKGYHVNIWINQCSWKADEVTGYVLNKGVYGKLMGLYLWLCGAFFALLVVWMMILDVTQ